jgi:hypothetical protein
MKGKKRNYSTVKKWAEKKGKEGWILDDLNAALSAYESSKQEIAVLKEALKEKTANRKKLGESLIEVYGATKSKLKQSPEDLKRRV